ncbi:hypothetical protein CFRA_03685 [Corynebacterium frankenforstense DSM 45800]|uniref:Uncharacterized protein n=1 Tax=Corynebacterium frankenforstense DSM 45800 TaxID=1437875 RepID=A0A1L7CRR5_9CORY|nr:hypothetical protein [Corynebacterium frankenforstense]APT88526.1 hypothetical protein CFRA_03685 [Corynebacterium frankenforstense DSM 45800]
MTKGAEADGKKSGGRSHSTWNAGELAWVPEGYLTDELPDWRIASFAIILPMPQLFGGCSEDGGDERLLDLAGKEIAGRPWRPGRFKGMKGVEVLWQRGTSNSDSGSDSPKWGEHPAGENRWDNMKSTFYHGAKSRFPGGLREAVGAEFSDCDLKSRNDGDDFRAPETWADVGVRHKHRMHMHNVTFDGDDEVTFELADEVDGKERRNGASCELKAVEVLEYQDVRVHEDFRNSDRKSDEPTPGANLLTESAREVSVICRFLVLHVWAQNCSSWQLERLSQSLSRPRGKFTAYTRDEEKIEKFSPVSHFAGLAIDGIWPEEKSAPIKLKSGGFLDYVTMEDREAGKGNEPGAPTLSERQYSRPQRVVVAIPAKAQVAPFPEVENYLLRAEEEGEETDVAWSDADICAWQLSTGADRYFDAVPDFHRAVARPTDVPLEHWRVSSATEGFAMVRIDTADPVAGKFWSLVPTRYVDLIVLQMRALETISMLTTNLRNCRVSGKAPGNESEGCFLDEVRGNLGRLQQIQTDFVEFRDRLWFSSVYRHPFDERLMLDTKCSLGLDIMFKDFTEELALREEIYNAQFSILGTEQQRAESRRRQQRQEDERKQEQKREHEWQVQQQQRQEDQERRAREQQEEDAHRRRRQEEREEEQQRREKSSSRMNLALACASAFIGAPAIVDIMGVEKDPLALLWTVGIALVIFALVGLFITFMEAPGTRKAFIKRNWNKFLFLCGMESRREAAGEEPPRSSVEDALQVDQGQPVAELAPDLGHAGDLREAETRVQA